MKKLSEQGLNRKNDGLRRLAVFLGASAVILIFSLCAPENAETFDMIGMELAVVALAIFLWKFPLGLYAATNLFTLSAAAGSILKLYDKFPGYDRVVHFVSGLLLGYIGVYLINRIFARLHMESIPVLGNVRVLRCRLLGNRRIFDRLRCAYGRPARQYRYDGRYCCRVSGRHFVSGTAVVQVS